MYQVSKLMKYGADVLQLVKITDHGDPGTVADFAHVAFKLVRNIQGSTAIEIIIILTPHSRTSGWLV